MNEYDPKKTYCNDGTGGEANLCCYHHDMGYKYPEGRTRKEVDQEFLRCMTRRGLRTKALIMYSALRVGGWYRWNELRKKYRNK